MSSVRPAAPENFGHLAEVLTRAFHDDPAGAWVMPDEDFRRRKSPAMFEVTLKTMVAKGGVWTDESKSGAALWAAPGKWKDSPLQAVRQLPALLSLGRCIGRAVRIFRLMEARHPSEPHWYLDVLGTDPDRQGRGIGSALLRPVLDRCDEQLVGAFLISSKESNIPFYERHGFRQTSELPVPDGPLLYPMWRDPRPPETT